MLVGVFFLRHFNAAVEVNYKAFALTASERMSAVIA